MNSQNDKTKGIPATEIISETKETLTEDTSAEESTETTNKVNTSDESLVETAPKMSTKKKVAIVVGAAVLVAAIGGGVALATNQPEEVQTPIIEEEAVVEAQDSKVSVEVAAKTKEEVIVDAEIEVIIDAEAELLDDESETVDEAIAIPLNEKTEITELEEGKYILRLTSAPIEIDGSSYRLPDEGIEFEVKGDGEDVAVSVELERIDVADMTREQLLLVSETILSKSSEHADLAAELAAKAEKTASSSELAEDLQQESESGGTPENPNTGEKAGSFGSSSGGNSGNAGGSLTQPSHSHSFKTPIYGDSPWIITQPYVPETPSKGYFTETYYQASDGTRFEIDQINELAQHCATNKLSYSLRGGDWVITEHYQSEIPEQGYWGPAPIVGYSCSCGAIK